VERLPDLDSLARLDGRLRAVAADEERVAAALEEAAARLEHASIEERTRLLGYSGNALRLLGRHDEAVATQRDALAAAIDERAALVARIRLGEALRCADALEDAERELRAAVEAARRRHVDLLDFALQHLGKTLLDAGRSDAAEPLEEALALREAKGDAELVQSTRAALERTRAG
jgi:tetratricopeptide (TPR) repeat protein